MGPRHYALASLLVLAVAGCSRTESSGPSLEPGGVISEAEERRCHQICNIAKCESTCRSRVFAASVRAECLSDCPEASYHCLKRCLSGVKESTPRPVGPLPETELRP